MHKGQKDNRISARKVKGLKLYDLTLHEVGDKMKKREISAKDLIDCIYKRIDEVEDTIGAYITLSKEKAYEQAEKVDKKIAEGEPIGDLTGIPMALKDNM